MTNTLSTHVLDLSRGRPADGLAIALERREQGETFRPLATGVTNADGRIKDWSASQSALAPGVYRLQFDTAAYFAAHGAECFYPYVHVVFEIKEAGGHYHVPLLLAPYGYSTYRGS